MWQLLASGSCERVARAGERSVRGREERARESYTYTCECQSSVRGVHRVRTLRCDKTMGSLYHFPSLGFALRPGTIENFRRRSSARVRVRSARACPDVACRLSCGHVNYLHTLRSLLAGVGRCSVSTAFLPSHYRRGDTSKTTSAAQSRTPSISRICPTRDRACHARTCWAMSACLTPLMPLNPCRRRAVGRRGRARPSTRHCPPES